MRAVRIVTWNVNQCRRDVWSALDAVSPDISLLNEAVIPVDRQMNGVWYERTDGLDDKHRPWSSAVLTPHPWSEIEEAHPAFRGNTRRVPLKSMRPGVWAVASIAVPELGEVTAISLYGMMDEISCESMHRSISEVVAPLADDPTRGRLLVVGGDFNTGTQWKQKESDWKRRDANVLARLEALGLVDMVDRHRGDGRLDGCNCTAGEECRHVRTRRDARWPDQPFQTDYLFASESLAARTTGCDVLANDDWFALSDHAPIVATLDA